MKAQTSAASRQRGKPRTTARLLFLGIASVAFLSFGIAPGQDLPSVAQSAPDEVASKTDIARGNQRVRVSSIPAIARNNEAVRLSREGRHAEAEQSFRAALEAGCEDELVRAQIASNLGELYERLDRYREAERMFRSALALREKNLPFSSLEVAYSLNNLAAIYGIEGRDLDARKLLETAAEHLQQTHPDAPGVPVVLTNLAPVLCRFNQFDQAKETLRAALNFYERHEQTTSRGYGIALNNLGQVLEVTNDLPSAAALYERAIGIFENLAEAGRSNLAGVLANAGAVFLKLNRVDDARQAEQRALALLHPGADTLLRAQILWNLGNIANTTGQPAAALPYFEQSLVTYEERLGAEHATTASLLQDYASATKRAGNKSLSRRLQKRAEDLLARLSSRSPSQSMVSLRDLHESR